MPNPSAFDLAARQVELDRAATARFPHLFDHKVQRLLVSPHAFLRGSAPLFYELLAAHPDLAEGPAGTGWIVGDLHLENVGAYRTDEDSVVFNLNDFDDSAIGPLRVDVLRLATSVLLAGRSFRCSGPDAIALAELLFASYLKAAWEPGSDAPPVPGPIADLVRAAGARSKKQLLDDRAPVEKGGKRRFVRGDRYFDLPAEITEGLPAVLRDYVQALGSRAPAHANEWQITDAVFRVAGTGSLGSLRIAALVREKNGDERILEFKEARSSSIEALVGVSPGLTPNASPAERVVAAARALVHEPVRHLAPVRGLGTSFIARKLSPQEDKLAIDSFHIGAKLSGIVQTIGHIVGVAHARAILERPATAWTSKDLAPVLDHAIEVAGIFEAVYLAYARRVGAAPTAS